MIKAVIFDCYGVLYLTAHQSLAERWPQHAREILNIRQQADYGMLSRQQYIERISQLVGADAETVANISSLSHTLNHPLVTYIEKELKPHYKIGMLSNIGRGWIQNMFDEYLLGNVFDVVVQSGDEGITKPHPRIFDLTAEKLGVEPEECVMVDDLPENIAGADAASMHGIVYGDLNKLKIELNKLLG